MQMHANPVFSYNLLGFTIWSYSSVIPTLTQIKGEQYCSFNDFCDPYEDRNLQLPDWEKLLSSILTTHSIKPLRSLIDKLSLGGLGLSYWNHGYPFSTTEKAST